MKITDIKLGQDLSQIKERIKKTNNIALSVLPSFMGSDYLSIKDLNTNENVYILVDEEHIITRITNRIEDVTELKRARDCIDQILGRNRK